MIAEPPYSTCLYIFIYYVTRASHYFSTNSTRISYPRRTVLRHFGISWNTVCQNGHYISPFLVAIQKSRTFIISSCTWAFLCLYIAVCTLSCLHFRIMTLFVFFVCVLSFFLIFVFWNFCSLIICLMNIKWFSTVTNSQTYFFFTLFAICAVFQFSLNFVINEIYIHVY